jgi:hypothetical protein
VRRLCAVLTVLLLAVLASACTAATDLKLGDCYDGGTGGTVVSVQPRSCGDPHDAEVFGVAVYPGGPDARYPGPSAVEAFAVERCPVLFRDYVGVELEASALVDGYLTPTEDSWKEGDRTVVCFLTAAQGKLTGSMRGAGR